MFKTPAKGQLLRFMAKDSNDESSIASLSMSENRMEKPFMLRLISGATEAIVKENSNLFGMS